jgi:three-Cys-motif partner protein
MGNELFFKESKDQSRVKAEIVAKYFWAWAKVVIPATRSQGIGKIAYIDLFAGPGRYEDGARSTPLLVLERAAEDPDIREMLVSLFNDSDSDRAGALVTALDSTPEIASLRHKPQVLNDEVGQQIVAQFEEMRLVPTFFFVDPWGYKGLSLRLINSVLKDWGCDCVFFFNYNRINMGLSNDLVQEHMDALFGARRADDLRAHRHHEPRPARVGHRRKHIRGSQGDGRRLRPALPLQEREGPDQSPPHLRQQAFQGLRDNEGGYGQGEFRRTPRRALL